MLMFDSKNSKNIPVRTPLEELTMVNVHTRQSILETFETSFRCFNSRFGEHVPKLLNLLRKYCAENKQALLRVQIVTIDPLSSIPEHIDEGYYYTLTRRHHLVVKSEGSTMEEEGEKTIYSEGAIFYLENRKPHRAYNESESERIHVIFDTLPLSLKDRLLRLYESSFLFSHQKNRVTFFVRGLWFVFLSSFALAYEE